METDAAPQWMKRVLWLAAAYNLAWGALVVLFPLAPFRWARMPPPNYPEIWQCLGMVVGVYGVGYAIAAIAPLRHWPIVFVGLLGKVLGPIGMAHAVFTGRLPPAAVWLCVTNDLVWWIPFGAILKRAMTVRSSALACVLLLLAVPAGVDAAELPGLSIRFFWESVNSRGLPPPSRFHWSKNVAVAPAENGRQRCETALATDAAGRVWLSFLDCDYRQVTEGTEIRGVVDPRRVPLYVSRDRGDTFCGACTLAASATDESLAADRKGALFAAWADRRTGSPTKLRFQRFDSDVLSRSAAALRPVSSALPLTATSAVECVDWRPSSRHDQSTLHVGPSGTVHVVGVDISTEEFLGEGLLYARSLDGGRTFVDRRRLHNVGHLPQIVETKQGLMIAGRGGYVTSADGGATFSTCTQWRFGSELVRVCAGPDRGAVLLIADNAYPSELFCYVSEDLGKSWRRSVVDKISRVHRYPAIRVADDGRVHAIWMDESDGFGAIYHSYSDDGAKTFVRGVRVSDAPFPFPKHGSEWEGAGATWIGDYLDLTTVGSRVVAAWSDQRAGVTRSTVFVAVGDPAP